MEFVLSMQIFKDGVEIFRSGSEIFLIFDLRMDFEVFSASRKFVCSKMRSIMSKMFDPSDVHVVTGPPTIKSVTVFRVKRDSVYGNGLRLFGSCGFSGPPTIKSGTLFCVKKEPGNWIGMEYEVVWITGPPTIKSWTVFCVKKEPVDVANVDLITCPPTIKSGTLFCVKKELVNGISVCELEVDMFSGPPTIKSDTLFCVKKEPEDFAEFGSEIA